MRSGRTASASSLGCTNGRRVTAASACRARPRRCWPASSASCQPKCAAPTHTPWRSALSRSPPPLSRRLSPCSTPAITFEDCCGSPNTTGQEWRKHRVFSLFLTMAALQEARRPSNCPPGRAQCFDAEGCRGMSSQDMTGQALKSVGGCSS